MKRRNSHSDTKQTEAVSRLTFTKQCGGLLATDLDGTLVGDDEGCRELFAYLQNRPEPVALAYITGRHLASAVQLMRQKSLPAPDFLITDVGTVLYHIQKNEPLGSSAFAKADRHWQEKMNRNWSVSAIRTVAAALPGLIEQNLPDHHRVSFTAANPAVADEFRLQLKAAAVPHTFIFSSGRDVDILPAGGGKGEALKHLIQTNPELQPRILAAGDSGNDRAMITAGYPAVIVANAQAELLAIAPDPLVYRARKSYAYGILEGWMHFYG